MPNDQPKRPRPTLKDVAGRAGVSVMLASYTFSRPERVSEASRAKVLTAAQEIGYRRNQAATALRTGTSGLLGVVVSEHLGYAFRDPGAMQFLAGVADVCAEHGKGMVLLPTGGNLDPAGVIASVDVDGYVFWTTSPEDPALAGAIATGQPVAIQGGPAVEGATCLTIDDHAAARAVTAEALRGSHHPVVLSFPADSTREAQQVSLGTIDAELPVTRHRIAGIQSAFEDANIAVQGVPCVVLTQNERTTARQAAAALLQQSPRTDSFICMSDEIALGAIEAVQDAGFTVPADVTITGFDGQPEALAQGITTIVQDLHQQGEQAALAALDRSQHQGGTTSWDLLVGTTTRKR